MNKFWEYVSPLFSLHNSVEYPNYRGGMCSRDAPLLHPPFELSASSERRTPVRISVSVGSEVLNSNVATTGTSNDKRCGCVMNIDKVDLKLPPGLDFLCDISVFAKLLPSVGIGLKHKERRETAMK